MATGYSIGMNFVPSSSSVYDSSLSSIDVGDVFIPFDSTRGYADLSSYYKSNSGSFKFNDKTSIDGDWVKTIENLPYSLGGRTYSSLIIRGSFPRFRAISSMYPIFETPEEWIIERKSNEIEIANSDRSEVEHIEPSPVTDNVVPTSMMLLLQGAGGAGGGNNSKGYGGGSGALALFVLDFNKSTKYSINLNIGGTTQGSDGGSALLYQKTNSSRLPLYSVGGGKGGNSSNGNGGTVTTYNTNYAYMIKSLNGINGNQNSPSYVLHNYNSDLQFSYANCSKEIGGFYKGSATGSTGGGAASYLAKGGDGYASLQAYKDGTLGSGGGGYNNNTFGKGGNCVAYFYY